MLLRGFMHEQCRVDRDNHVIIYYDSIADPSQYDIMSNPQPGYYGVPYDLGSIMHYASFANSMVARDPRRNFLMGQRIGLSFLDAKLANLAYKCSGN